jgi:rfaE bifunctional protein nucleotidyltransferase chain/domain
VTLDEAVRLAAKWRRDGMIVVLASGVFDLLHPGHARYLEQARALGDALVVSVRSDRSAAAIAGSSPVAPEAERAEIVEALRTVDATVICDDETFVDAIAALGPDVLVTGDESCEHAVEGREPGASPPARVVRLAIDRGYSTAAIIEKIKRSTL